MRSFHRLQIDLDVTPNWTLPTATLILNLNQNNANHPINSIYKSTCNPKSKIKAPSNTSVLLLQWGHPLQHRCGHRWHLGVPGDQFPWQHFSANGDSCSGDVCNVLPSWQSQQQQGGLQVGHLSAAAYGRSGMWWYLSGYISYQPKQELICQNECWGCR